MTTLTKTRAAARQLCQYAPTTLARSRAQLLCDQLTTCDTSPALLRQVVIAVRDLTGSCWLRANADHPDVRAFSHLDTMPSPPPPPVLDAILARCLLTRFCGCGRTEDSGGQLAGASAGVARFSPPAH